MQPDADDAARAGIGHADALDERRCVLKGEAGEEDLVPCPVGGHAAQVRTARPPGGEGVPPRGGPALLAGPQQGTAGRQGARGEQAVGDDGDDLGGLVGLKVSPADPDAVHRREGREVAFGRGEPARRGLGGTGGTVVSGTPSVPSSPARPAASGTVSAVPDSAELIVSDAGPGTSGFWSATSSPRHSWRPAATRSQVTPSTRGRYR